MVRKKQAEQLEYDGLEDIGVDEEVEETPVVQTATNAQVANSKASSTRTVANGNSSTSATTTCKDSAEALQCVRDATQLLERVFNWSTQQNQSLPFAKQLNFIAISVNYLQKPLVTKDGKMQVDEAGNPVMEKPSANVHLRLGLTSDALSLPLNQSVTIPEV